MSMASRTTCGLYTAKRLLSMMKTSPRNIRQRYFQK